MPSIGHLLLGGMLSLILYYFGDKKKFTKYHAFILFVNNYMGPDLGWVLLIGEYTHTIVGFVIFAIAMIGAGALFFPHVLYLYHGIYPVAPKFAKVFAFFLLFTPIGMIGAGIINEDLIFAVHYVLGGLCFGGIGLAAIFGFFFSIVRLKRHEPWPSLSGVAIVYGIIIAGLTYLVFMAITVDISDPRAMHIPEWVMFVTLFSWLVGFYLLIPGEKAPKNKSKKENKVGA